MNWRLQIVSIIIRRLTVFSLAESLHLMGARSNKVRKKIAKGKKPVYVNILFPCALACNKIPLISYSAVHLFYSVVSP